MDYHTDSPLTRFYFITEPNNLVTPVTAKNFSYFTITLKLMTVSKKQTTTVVVLPLGSSREFYLSCLIALLYKEG